MIQKLLRTLLATTAAVCIAGTASAIITIDFEGLPDLTPVGSFYSGQGVIFQNSIALTAGFSLNEIEFPPSSGLMAVGDEGGPIILSFSSDASAISGYFAHASSLTYTAYDAVGGLIGSYVDTGPYLGATELISLSFTGVRELRIQGQTPNSFIMDDLSFTPHSTPDTGSTLVLLGGALSALLLFGCRRERVSPTY